MQHIHFLLEFMLIKVFLCFTSNDILLFCDVYVKIGVSPSLQPNKHPPELKLVVLEPAAIYLYYF